MKRLLSLILTCMIGLTLLPAVVGAQPAPGAVTFSQQELDQLLAPIALYPDPLLSQVLVAATYPLETVQAARFARQNPSLKGDALARAMAVQPWDSSVKALVQFPSVLFMMDDQLAWTQKLGDAFLAQQTAVMDTVQSLRAKAQAAGTLRSNQQQSVDTQDGMIDIAPYAADTVSVPYYDPTIVYGAWWWPNRPPFVWEPPVEYQTPDFGVLFMDGVAFGVGVGIIDSLFFPVVPDWIGHRFINGNWPGRMRPGGQGRPAGTVWTHNPMHRHGVAYRDAATRDRFHPSLNGAGRDAYRGQIGGHIGGHVEGSPQQAGHPHVDGQNRSSEVREPVQQPMRQPIEQVHPFMPAGSAGVIQSHSERGQSSRAGSSFSHANSRQR